MACVSHIFPLPCGFENWKYVILKYTPQDYVVIIIYLSIHNRRLTVNRAPKLYYYSHERKIKPFVFGVFHIIYFHRINENKSTAFEKYAYSTGDYIFSRSLVGGGGSLCANFNESQLKQNECLKFNIS